MDLTQIVVILSLIAITTIIVITGIQLTKVLQEVRQTVIKTNKILEDAEMITASVAKPVSSISEFVMGFRNGLTFFNKLFNKEDERETE